MLRSRIIPCLLIQNKGLVKTQQFQDPKYVGDPLNAVRIFNEKEVDELMVLDIDATTKGSTPDFEVIRNLAVECRMPLCYGGGVSTVEQAQKIVSLGAEKVAVSSAVLADPSLVARMAAVIGSQSVVVVLDVKKKRFGGYAVYTHNGTKSTKVDPVDFARKVEALGAGELVINSIDKDGMMGGYDYKLIDKIRGAVSIPMSVLGGAGSHAHLRECAARYGTIGLAAGSLFVFKGKYRAVLISYPARADKDKILGTSLAG